MRQYPNQETRVRRVLASNSTLDETLQEPTVMTAGVAAALEGGIAWDTWRKEHMHPAEVERDDAVDALEGLREWVEDARMEYPPDTDFAKGYKSALEDVLRLIPTPYEEPVQDEPPS